MSGIPTFEQWHAEKYLQSFEDEWMRPNMLQVEAFKAMMRRQVEYNNFMMEYFDQRQRDRFKALNRYVKGVTDPQ